MTAKTNPEAAARILTAEELAQASGGHNPPGCIVAHNPPGDIVAHNPPGYLVGQSTGLRQNAAVPPDPY